MARKNKRNGTSLVQHNVSGQQFAEASGKAAKPSLAEIGVAGDEYQAGLPVDAANSEMSGPAWFQKVDLMRRTGGYVEVVSQVITLPIISTEWDVQGDREDLVEFVRTNLLDSTSDTAMSTTWQDVLRRACLSVLYGTWCMEKVWRVDGQATIRRLVDRLPRTITAYNLDADGTILGLHQKGRQPDGTEVDTDIGIDNLLLFPYRKEGNNWNGMSILRGAHQHWDISQSLTKLLNIGAERALTPSPVGHLPLNYSEEDRRTFLAVMERWRRNSAGSMALPSGYTVDDLVKLAGTEIAAVIAWKEHHDLWFLRTALADFVTLGESARALGDVKILFFLLAWEAFANELEATINRHLVRQLVRYNFPNVTGGDMPRVVHQPIGQWMNLEAASDFLKVLLDGKVVVPDGPTDENFFRRGLGLREKDETATAPPPPPAATQVGNAPDAQAPAEAIGSSAPADQGASGAAPTPAQTASKQFSEADVAAAAAAFRQAGQTAQDAFQMAARSHLQAMLTSLLEQISAAGGDAQQLQAVAVPAELVTAYGTTLAG